MKNCFFRIHFALAIAILSFTSCDKEKDRFTDMPCVTSDATEVSESSAKLHGWCYQESVPGASVVYGIEYSATDLTTAATTLMAEEKDADNQYCCQATGLSSNTLYYYRAFSLFNGVKTYGEVKTFTTLAVSMTVTTMAATDITEFAATLNGLLKADCKDELSKEGWFLFSETENSFEGLKENGQKVTSSLQGDGSFKAEISDLKSGTRYYYLAVARVYDRDFYSEQVLSFTTQSITATIETLPATNVYTKKASISGSLTYLSNSALEKKVWFMYSDSESTLAGLKSNGTELLASLQENGSFTGEAGGLKGGTTYYYVAQVRIGDTEYAGNLQSFTTDSVPEGAVELGLSVCWAPFNVGASSPEEYGDYYAWGETEPKTVYNWTSYKWCNGDYDNLTKYNTYSSFGTVDNKTVLEPEDDAARIKLAGRWRMPTDDEWTELRKNCSWTWTTDNGVNGYLVISDNGNSIFLPAAGCRNGSDLAEVGSTGSYWSSSLNTDVPQYAWYLLFSSDSVSRFGYYGRYFGFSVRPVTD